MEEKRRVLKRRKRANNLIPFPFMHKRAREFNEKLRASGKDIPVSIYADEVDGFRIMDILMCHQLWLSELAFVDDSYKKGFEKVLEQIRILDKGFKILGSFMPKNKREKRG
jgi:hypothetical protein